MLPIPTRHNSYGVRFLVLTAASMKPTFPDKVSFSLVETDCLGGTASFIALVMKAVRTSEMSVCFQETILHNIPEDLSRSTTAAFTLTYLYSTDAAKLLGKWATVTSGW
jgi:hypothetical protein